MLISSTNGRRRRDRRYSVRPEYCGFRHRRFVARFCGEWIGARRTRAEAIELVCANAAERMGPFTPRGAP